MEAYVDLKKASQEDSQQNIRELILIGEESCVKSISMSQVHLDYKIDIAKLLCQKVNNGEDISVHDEEFKQIMQDIKKIIINPRKKFDAIYDSIARICPNEWCNCLQDTLNSVVAWLKKPENTDAELKFTLNGVKICVKDERIYANGRMAYLGGKPVEVKDNSLNISGDEVTIGNTMLDVNGMGLVFVNGRAASFSAPKTL
ncbi:MAG: hypothetical protein LBM38_00540 [Clostridiales bacterium]|jgi:hypothetical protein|nr:hypothetical protein [Clostridiales bacterium]